MKRLLFLVLILVSCGLYAQSVGPFSPQEIGGISSILSPIKFGGKKLPSWLTSEYSPIFNGVNQFASIATSTFFDVGPTDDFTFMSWIKTSVPISNTPQTLYCKGDYGDAAPQKLIVLLRDNGASYNGIYLRINSGTADIVAWPSVDQSSVFNDFRWHHVAVGRSGTTGFIYVDGAAVPLAFSNLDGGRAVNTRLPFFGVGAQANAPVVGSWFNGGMAETLFFNRALSASDIQRYYTKRLKGTETGLVALYHMNDNAQTLVDSVGGKNAVASNSITWTKRNGYSAPDVRSERYALSFDGVDDYASAPCDVSTYPFTLSAWAFTPTLAASRGVFFGIFNNASTTQDIYAGVTNDAGVYRALGVVTNGGSVGTASSTGAFLGRWSNITLVGESSILRKLFIDGVQTATSTTEIQFPSAVSHYGIGVLNRATKAYSFGKFAHFTAWDKALSQAEIRALIYSPAPNLSDANLRKYVEITEGTGTSLDDLSAANVNLALTNSPTWVGRDIP